MVGLTANLATNMPILGIELFLKEREEEISNEALKN